MSTSCFDHEVENLAFECDLTLPQARQVAQLGLNAIDPAVHQDVVAHLADPIVASAYFDAFFGAFPDSAALFLEAQARRALVAGHDNAGVWTAVAHAAEFDGDVVGWIAHLDTALHRDPTFTPALLDRGYAAWLQGDHATALRLLDGLDHPKAVVMSVAIGLSQPIRARVARNRRCPCGSGLKSKRCCRGVFQLPVLAERLLWVKMQLWLTRFPQDQARRAVALELTDGDDDDELLDMVLCEGATNSIALLEAGLIDRFAATAGPLLSADDLAALDRWRTSRHRLWEVRSLDRNTAELIDLVDGEVRPVLDEGVRCCVVPGQLLYGAVLPVGGHWFMPQHLPMTAAEAEPIAERIGRDDDPMSIAIDVYGMVSEAPPP